VKTVNNKVSVAYLSVRKLLVGELPFYVKIWRKVTFTLQHADFQSTFACSASAVTASK